MILAKFGQKLLAVENSAGIALGCIEADFLRFESSGIARRCAQPLPQHHFAILNKSAKIIFAYICLFHNRITFLAFSDRVFNFSPRRFIVEYSRCLSVCDVFRCVCRFLQVNTRWPRFLKLCRRKQHHVLFEASRFVRSATTRPAVSGTTSPPARNFSPLRLCKILFKTSRGLRY